MSRLAWLAWLLVSVAVVLGWLVLTDFLSWALA